MSWSSLQAAAGGIRADARRPGLGNSSMQTAVTPRLNKRYSMHLSMPRSTSTTCSCRVAWLMGAASRQALGAELSGGQPRYWRHMAPELE